MTIFQIFTLIGSILGIIAFFINFLTPICNYNKNKWESLKQVISPLELEEYVSAIGQGRLPKDLHYKVLTLIYLIRKDSDDINFKCIFSNKPRKYLKDFYESFYQMQEKLQRPYWDTPDNPSVAEDYKYVINKEYFYIKSKGLSNEYNKLFKSNLDYVSDKADRMNELYRNVFKELNKLPFEYIRFW